MYRTLDSARIIDSLDTLGNRITERFPGAGLACVCTELSGIARESERRIREIGRPNLPLRFGVVAFLLAAVWLLWRIAPYLDFEKRTADNIYSVLQGVDAAMNILVLMGAMTLFLFAVEERMKRRRALAAVHELRSLIHVIDMHQLTKDPSSVAFVSQPTASSPKRTMTPFELTRYLDYCSELLSLSAKVAALYAQGLPDAIVVDAVSDIERLTTNLSSKVWQKISLIEQHALVAQGSAIAAPKPAPAPVPPPAAAVRPAAR
jgi:hypothetical protein